MVVQAKSDATVVNELKARLEQLEQQADALRSGLDDIALLFTWTMDRSISSSILQKILIGEEQVAAQRQWDGQTVPVEVARLFLQAHTVATRLKHLVPREDKEAAVKAVVETFRQIAQEQHWQVPVEMEVTIGD
jgi:hypothetical protein